MKELAPKIVTTNGSGSTEAGLRASAVKDEMTGSWNLEAGAVILADGGLLTIDEFDKLNTNVMESLNEPLEELYVSIAKAGLSQVMTSRTSLLAGANPKYGTWKEDKSFNDQVLIPNTTLSRFDLMYLLKDTVDADRDRIMVEKILSGNVAEDKPMVDVELFRKYISYAKSNIFPVLSSSAIKLIANFYSHVRQLASESPDGKLITQRETMALERLATAKAKLRLSKTVEVEDAKEAIRIYQDSLETLGLDILHINKILDVRSDLEFDCISYGEELLNQEVEEFGNNIPKSTLHNLEVQVREKFDSFKEDEITKLFKTSCENILEKNLI